METVRKQVWAQERSGWSGRWGVAVQQVVPELLGEMAQRWQCEEYPGRAAEAARWENRA